jgi:carbon monoxide dehydrogenase subunit G
MKLEQSFTVTAPIEQVWSALVDVERVAPCLPGAEITGQSPDGGYEGTFTVKLGPATASYRGSLRMESLDEENRVATMSAKGTDKRGQGGATASIVSTMTQDGDATLVEVATDFTITGRLARFGRGGMIEDISKRLMREFANCLQSTLAADPAPAGEPATEEPAAEAAIASATAAVPEAAASAPEPAASVADEPASMEAAGAAEVASAEEAGAEEAASMERAGAAEAAAAEAAGAKEAAAAEAAGAEEAASLEDAGGEEAAPFTPRSEPAEFEPAPLPPSTEEAEAAVASAGAAPLAGEEPGGPDAPAAGSGASPLDEPAESDPHAPLADATYRGEPAPDPDEPAEPLPDAAGATEPAAPLPGEEAAEETRVRRAGEEDPWGRIGPSETDEPAPPPEPPAKRSGSIPPPSGARPPVQPAKPVNGLALFFGVLGDRIKRLFSRKRKN